MVSTRVRRGHGLDDRFKPRRGVPRSLALLDNMTLSAHLMGWTPPRGGELVGSLRGLTDY
jgi:hypothetical protein